MTKEILLEAFAAVERLNDEFYRQSEGSQLFWPFILKTDGKDASISFFELLIWHSDDDPRERDETDQYFLKTIEEFVAEEAHELIGAISNVSFKAYRHEADPNLELLAELGAFRTRCERHDWFYYMSDDHSVFLQGDAACDQLIRDARKSDEHKRIYNAVHKSRFDRPEFLCGKREYKLPFPEAEKGGE